MDAQAIGQAVESGIRMLILVTVVVTAVIVGGGTFLATRWFSPTHESVEREKAKQAVIESLTPEQKNALGFD